MDDNNPDSPFVIEAILQKAFTKEELQNQDNIKFGITVALIFLDLTYDQVEILSSKFKCKESLEDDGIEEPLEDDRIEELLEYDIMDHNGNESFVFSDNESEDSNGQESDS
ncbi:12521_t:CDS:2 [Funneliformis caledonium]|uniref:12521_t:CDS:1 n=1 Tax=Funneliformis caledonium TaxID=1117310 RepID=A0A9N9DI24_9GLOM|nr:12521_t:CDS:2 [Funneliformis caledonium]